MSLSAEMCSKGSGAVLVSGHIGLDPGSQALGHYQVMRGHGHLSLPLLAAFHDQAIRNSCGIYTEMEISLWEEQRIWISVLALGCSSILICFHQGLGTGIVLPQQT